MNSICTNVKQKREHWEKFSNMIESQFEHGGEKYAFSEDMEGTDVVCQMSPGKTGFDWVLQTIVKYALRFLIFKRERDLLKIATYAYIAWLKSGFQLSETHDEDVSVNKKDVEEA
jgi:hypothetical protein